MGSVPDSLRNPERLAALAETGLSDSEAEEAFDRLTRMVTRLLQVPVSLVSLVDDKRQFFKSQQGLTGWAGEQRQTPLSHSFCQHVVIQQKPLLISDAERDPLVRENLAVTDLGVKAYLGVPLILPSGHVIGSLCALDSKPRPWSEADLQSLSDVADIVMSEIGLRREIAERKRAEESRELLIAELHHRVKNTLSTVQALIQLNLRSSPSIEDFRSTISGRIASLSRTHTLLTQRRWAAIAFRDILKSELEAYEQAERVSLSGPEFDLDAEIATTVGMVIHELTTNAAKYGALSLPAGRIEARWTIDAAQLADIDRGDSHSEARVTLIWTERGGPPARAPERKGFGSSLIERLIVRQFDGAVDFDFAPEGLSFRASFPVPLAVQRDELTFGVPLTKR
jgi:two-component sensor histidine kinase